MKNMTETIEDPAQVFYKEKNKDLDLEREVDPYAMWAFALSFGFIYTSMIPFIGLLIAPVCPFVSVIFGIMSLNRIKKRKDLKGKGFAIAAIIISGIEILIGLLILMIGIGLVTAMAA